MSEIVILNFNSNRGLPVTSFIWSVAVIAALIAAVLKGGTLVTLLPYALVALIPAATSLVLWPFANREWAQMMVIMSWIALAIIACFAIAFIPMAILFLCAPAAAALFEREKVVEAMLFSAVFAGVVFYAGRFGYAPDSLANPEQINWGQMAGIVATIAFVLGALFSSSSVVRDEEPIVAANVLDIYPGIALKFSDKAIIEEASPEARKLFELKKNHFGTMNLASLFAAADDNTSETGLWQTFGKAQHSEQYTSTIVTVPNETENGSEVTTQYDLKMMPQQDGSVLVFVEESSELAKKMEILEASNAQAAKQASEKTLFFAGVSHELRTPLNAIIGFSDMMRSRLFGPLPGKYAEYADLIHDSGQHMLDLIGDVLDLSKVEAGKYELQYDEFDMADVVRSSIKMIRPSADAASLTILTEVEIEKDLVVEADRKAIRQILLNLLSNAVKFTPKGGKIIVSTKESQGALSLSVEDNGMGMTKDDVDIIGTAYTQAASARLIDTRGSGLGLSLVKELVDLHKGRFSISSHPGAGTRVEITLPTKKPMSE